ncbi:MAG: hypothetical protein HKP58_10390 [Desulfatitalea sp.]|nr:hypothetical protein [Desulfatitalea sp.]NNK00809.1 hypothetical protein [Desulfatitalea sp.]
MGEVYNTIAIDIINAFTNNPERMFPAAFVAITVGYIYYVYSFLLIRRDKKSSIPLWLHVFFLADDTTACVIFFLAAMKYNWYWFYVMFSVGMFIWIFFELYCIRFALLNERQEIRGGDKPVTMKQGIVYVIALYAVSMVVVNMIIVWTGDEVMMQMFTICNILAVTVPPLYWWRSKTREGACLGFALNNIFIAFTNFLPPGYGWWTTGSSYFDHPMWYIAGVVLTLYTIGAFIMLKNKPPRATLAGQKKSLW